MPVRQQAVGHWATSSIIGHYCKFSQPHKKHALRRPGKLAIVYLPCPKTRAKQGISGASKHKQRVFMRVRPSLSMIHHLWCVRCCPCRSIHKRRKLFYGVPPHPPPTQCCAPFFGFGSSTFAVGLVLRGLIFTCNLMAQRWSCRGLGDKSRKCPKRCWVVIKPS